MKYLKKVSASQLISNEGTIIDSMNSGDDQHTNAPSISAVKGYVENYSTTETVIGTWLGKPLYRKVVDLGSLPSGTAPVGYDIGYTLSQINLVKIYGNAKSSTAQIPLPYVTADSGDPRIALTIGSSGKINLRVNTDMSSFTGYAVIEYTKTSD